MRAILRRPLSENFLKLFVLFSLCLPVVTSQIREIYSPEFVLVNAFALGYIATVIGEGQLARRGKQPLIMGLFALLVCFNGVAFLLNTLHLEWFTSQENISIPFLLFMALMLSQKGEEQERVLKFFLWAIIITNLVGIIPYFLNYYGLDMLFPEMGRIRATGEFGERRYNWIYLHKSEYAFMLLLFLGLLITYRDRFPKKWMYWLGVGVMLFGLVISNARTAMVAAVLIFAGLLADTVRKQPRKIRRRWLLCLIPMALVLGVLVLYIARDKDILSLGGRTYIWKAGLQQVLENPLGLGRACGTIPFAVPELSFEAYNAHNVVLNMLLQFSIPGGLLCVAMFAVVAVAGIRRKPSFLTAGIWAALLICMSMDWCLLLPQWSVFMLCMYYLFFYERRDENER